MKKHHLISLLIFVYSISCVKNKLPDQSTVIENHEYRIDSIVLKYAPDNPTTISNTTIYLYSSDSILDKSVSINKLKQIPYLSVDTTFELIVNRSIFQKKGINGPLIKIGTLNQNGQIEPCADPSFSVIKNSFSGQEYLDTTEYQYFNYQWNSNGFLKSFDHKTYFTITNFGSNGAYPITRNLVLMRYHYTTVINEKGLIQDKTISYNLDKNEIQNKSNSAWTTKSFNTHTLKGIKLITPYYLNSENNYIKSSYKEIKPKQKYKSLYPFSHVDSLAFVVKTYSSDSVNWKIGYEELLFSTKNYKSENGIIKQYDVIDGSGKLNYTKQYFYTKIK